MAARRELARPPAAHLLRGTRSAGVLLHPTSLPGGHGVGDLGPESHRFMEWLSRAGYSWWQMLPVGPIGPGNSPYASTSSFAGEELLVSLDHLAEDRLLTEPELRRARVAGGKACVDFPAARIHKRRALLAARDRFAARRGFSSAAFKRFTRESSTWLPDYLGWLGAEPHGLDAFAQFRFSQDWLRLREAAQTLGIRLIGDVPIFVDARSADVAANPELFRLDRRGTPTVVTGVPPDCFSATGQRWGHPHYRWSAHQASRFAWWRARMRIALQRFDLIRLDHFVGFHHAYEIPASAPDARAGQWRKQAGRELLEALAREFGSLPLIAEDLGAVTPEVARLRDAFDLPGMRVMHHAFWSGTSGDLPHHHRVHSVAYSGTHDNNTTKGWWAGLDRASKARCRALAGQGHPHEALSRLLMSSPATLAIVPAQDILGLGASARMNLPGASRGQWSWRMRQPLTTSAGSRWRALLEASGRASEAAQSPQ
ncbi:MAG: 4-alpha-glucanotransferase [Planctomycetota bacterium]|nr:4-alpha-glucanotransferase [Planctomycetota bacterium]MDA1105638.1 4-alpha-glucanotransferase [Planctomycetota bacterium]